MPNSVEKFTGKLPTLYQSFIHLSRYARWVDGEGRRETWEETVDRYVDYMCDVQCKGKIDRETKKEIREAILNLEVMPSMRCMMTAGKALAQDSISGFNCTYAAIDDVAVFSEIMYVLMAGAGAGISVERQFVNMLPTVADKMKPSRTIIKVEDSRIGWADSYKELMGMLYQGRIPEWDVSEVRPAGAKLKTFGGRASGPAPLVDLFKFTIEIFKGAVGRKLSSLECHDLCCKIAEIVCCGGVRRCLEEGTEVLMSDYSWRKIKDVRVGDMICWEGSPLPVVEVYDNGVQDMVEIELEEGKTFKCTENHRWYVYDNSDDQLKWVEAKDLDNGIYSFVEPYTAYLQEVPIKDRISDALIKVVSVKNVGSGRVMDIEVGDKRHAFIARSENGAIGVSHNSAILSLSNPSDDRMRHAKSGSWHDVTPWRSMANNSSCYTEKPGIDVFMREWLALYDSKSGERGIFNREAACKQAAKNGKRDASILYGCNPSLRKGTKVFTKDGIFPIEELEGKSFVVRNLNGKESEAECWLSGKDKPLYEIELVGNHKYYATAEHQWPVIDGGGKVEKYKTVELKRGHRFPVIKAESLPSGGFGTREQGFVLGESLMRPSVCKDKGFGLPACVWNEANEEYRRGLVDGLFSSDVSFYEGVSLTSNEINLVNDLSELLGFYGIKNSIEKDEGYELRICPHSSITHFKKLFPLSNIARQERLDDLANKVCDYIEDDYIEVESVRLTEMKEDVWDIRVNDDTHCFQLAHCITGNCSEIILRSDQCCNLSEVVVRKDDTAKDLKRKVEIAAILGTMQATLTNFRYLRPIWKKNTEEEALLGVSLTGIMDNELTIGRKGKRELVDLLETLNEHTVAVNKKWAGILGISPSAAITCVKPSGTVGALVDCASGIHPRYAETFIRRVRCDKKDPIAKLMMDVGFPYENDVYSPEHQVVFSFPMKAPKGAVISDDMSAIEQLEMWKVYQNHWCDHKVSQTVYIKEHEWMDVGAWVYRNFDIMSGVAFLPWSNHNYKQAPFEAISEKEYEEMLSKMPKSVDWSRLRDYEDDDGAVTAHREISCSGNSCELVDITKSK